MTFSGCVFVHKAISFTHTYQVCNLSLIDLMRIQGIIKWSNLSMITLLKDYSGSNDICSHDGK